LRCFKDIHTIVKNGSGRDFASITAPKQIESQAFIASNMTKTLFTFFSVCFLFLFALLPTPVSANKYADSVYTIRTIVLDAGHGGDKPGARGSSSLEKNIALQVTLKLGKAIEQNIPGVKVYYTRTTDVDVDLYKRIEVANQKKADLFISIHCNSVPAKMRSRVSGTETFVSGFSRLGEQDAAVRENADILLEENYKDNYQGFDPQDPESYIVFSLIKNQYRDQSIRLASLIQDEYVRSGRIDRGVQELSLAVLARAGMPAVLTEIGFISHPSEEQYMKSEKGQAEIVKNLLDAIKAYKRQVER